MTRANELLTGDPMMNDGPEPAPGAPLSPPGDPDALAQRAAAEIMRQSAAPLPGGLYLVATPIGNLADITLRALSVLARADIIYCEDTRHSRTLTGHYAIGTRLYAYHEHNGERERPRILAALAAGKAIALISDAGTPLISDPGYKLVREAVEAGHRVECLPGPSAALSALACAGLPTDAFFFAGFMPPKRAARQARIDELKSVPGTLIFFEAPSRIGEALADLSAVLGDRPGVVARELTKRFETITRGTLGELAAAHAALEPRGEHVILVAPPPSGTITDTDIEASLVRAMESLSLRDASKAVAEALGVPKTRVYDLGLRLKA